MFVRLTYLNFSPDNKEAAVEIYNKEIALGIRRQQGNKDASLLEPLTEGDEYISSSLWEDRSDLDRFEASDVYKELIGRISQLVDKKPYQKYYKVSR